VITKQEQRVLELIDGGKNFVPKRGNYNNGWWSGRPYDTACALERKGYVRQREPQCFEVVPEGSTMSNDPDWIWLPNSLMDGVAAEVPPIERIRQTHNLVALRVFVDLYHVHNLADDGGVNWRPPNGFRKPFERIRLGESHEYTIWGFRAKNDSTWTSNPVFAPHYDKADDGKRFWEAWTLLRKIGLVDTVAHLVDADSADGEPIHPIANGNGEEGERAVLKGAMAAATALMMAEQVQSAERQAIDIMIPVLNHLANVHVVGIVRLKHRPRTRATAAWYAKASTWADFARRYEALATAAEARRSW
jgi:hypothetical protein